MYGLAEANPTAKIEKKNEMLWKNERFFCFNNIQIFKCKREFVNNLIFTELQNKNCVFI